VGVDIGNLVLLLLPVLLLLLMFLGMLLIGKMCMQHWLGQAADCSAGEAGPWVSCCCVYTSS
jgi:hypothetical protein